MICVILHRVGCAHVLHDLLHEILGLPIGVGSLSCGVILIEQQILGIPINGGRGGEHNLLDAALHHDLKHIKMIIPLLTFTYAYMTITS